MTSHECSKSVPEKLPDSADIRTSSKKGHRNQMQIQTTMANVLVQWPYHSGLRISDCNNLTGVAFWVHPILSLTYRNTGFLHRLWRSLAHNFRDKAYLLMPETQKFLSSMITHIFWHLIPYNFCWHCYLSFRDNNPNNPLRAAGKLHTTVAAPDS